MYQSFVYAMRGLHTVWREERNFRTEVAVGLIVLFAAFVLSFTWIERALLALAVTIVLTAEIVNTTVEDLCDKIQPKRDPVIGKIKDIMASYVLVSAVGAAAIGLCVVISHFM